MSLVKRPVVLTILDGWGYSEEAEGNAVMAAHTPVWDTLWAEYPHTLISGSGEDVGLPEGQMGNSEVGHLNIGAGRVVPQDYTRITRDIRDGGFFDNEALGSAVDKAVAADRTVHVIGLLSPGGVHSHEDHIHAMAELAVRRGARKLCVHAFLDGRDTPPRSALASLEALAAKLDELGAGRIVSVIGRYYAMDRDKRWERINEAYDLLTTGDAAYQAASAAEALEMAYARGENDEFVRATAITGDGRPAGMQDGDVVVFMNFRSDRARQLTQAFTADDFDGFHRHHQPKLAAWVCLTQYRADFNLPVAYPPVSLANGLGEYVAAQGLRQLRIAETEKYAHVTFFFNGGMEEPFAGEDRLLVPSPRVATYDLQPEMSAPELTDRLVAAIEEGNYDMIICNYANPDMVGHSGIMDAAVRAVETVDQCVGRVMAALHKVGGEIILTADHGNAEQMRDNATGQAHTAHTSNPVPVIYAGRPATLAQGGRLCDLAPSMLTLMGLEQPAEMSGQSLVRLQD